MITIEKPGLLTTIQDLGRTGYQKFGVVTSGAMDPIAHRVANLLVGNSEREATIEMTVAGPVVSFSKDTIISVCGGGMSPMLNGNPLPLWKPVFIKKGSVLSFKTAKYGARAYLAVYGGLNIPEVLGSRSTYLRASLGGYMGRALLKGDQLYIPDAPKAGRFPDIRWNVADDIKRTPTSPIVIRAIKGRQYHLFTKESQNAFFSEGFSVSTDSDRMGYRLKGPDMQMEKKTEMLSEPISLGTIQVPANGNPIILLADRQTVGGYPKIAEVATVDISLLAQAKPGDTLYFKEISHREAQRFYMEQEESMAVLKWGIHSKYKNLWRGHDARS